MALMKICKRCGAFIPYPLTYCDSCQAIIDAAKELAKAKSKREADRRYNAKRDPKYLRFYNSPQWKMLSAKYLQGQGYRCEDCHRIATEVHHIDPIQTVTGWERRLDYTNLRALCTSCHNKAHQRFQSKRADKPNTKGIYYRGK